MPLEESFPTWLCISITGVFIYRSSVWVA
jgi:hypothetical protein